MKVSIALATYNGAPYLQEQLESFLTQSRQPDELIVTDDNSDDSTLSILRRFAWAAPFTVRILRNPKRLGPTANFSKALSLTSGDLVALSDQDDVWFSCKLQSIEHFLESNSDTHLLINDAILANERLLNTGQTRIGQIKASRFPLSNFVQGSCTTVRRDFLRSTLPIPTGTWTHDAWLHAAARLLDVRTIWAEPLQYFRRHDRNSSASPTSQLGDLTLLRALASRAHRNFHSDVRRPQVLAEELLKLQTLWRWWQATYSHSTLATPSLISPRSHQNGTVLASRLEAGLHRLQLVLAPRIGRVIPAAQLYNGVGSEAYGGPVALAKDLLLK